MDACTVARMLANAIIRDLPDQSSYVDKRLAEVLQMCGYQDVTSLEPSATSPALTLSSLGLSHLAHGSPAQNSAMHNDGGKSRQHKRIKVKTGNQVKTLPIVNAAKKPLNGFVGFRSYYRRIFADYQQKEASGWIATLWGAEVAKAKWQLIGAAYSRIRDVVGKQNAALSDFLDLVCPILKVIPPQDYLKVMGWHFDANAGVLTRQIIVNEASIPSCYSVTQHTVSDIVRFSTSLGYGVVADILNINNNNNNRKHLRLSNEIPFPLTCTAQTLAQTINAHEMPTSSNVLSAAETTGADPLDTDAFSLYLLQNFVKDNSEPTIESAEQLITSNDASLHESQDAYPFLDQFSQDDSLLNIGLFLDVDHENIDVGEIPVDLPINVDPSFSLDEFLGITATQI